MFGSNSDWYYKFVAGIAMAQGSRGWQQLVLQPEVWNMHRGVSICANLSSTEASIDTPRGLISAAWKCLPGNSGNSMCQEVPEHSTAKLGCPTGETIKSVDFASFGVPLGSCSSGFSANATCDDHGTKKAVEALCVGKSTCSIDAETKSFGHNDPCFNVTKKLAVQVSCSQAPGPVPAGTPAFAYAVSIPTGSTASVVLPQFGSKTAEISEVSGAVWKNGAYTPGVAGVTGASTDAKGNVVIAVGAGSYTFTVFI